jgi:folate-binding protein YgfZ
VPDGGLPDGAPPDGAPPDGAPPNGWRLGRDVLRAAGPEAASYLQGQLSQDVLALADGNSAWSWLLAPNGKVDALVRVTRLSAEEWLIDTDGGWGEAVAARLVRFRLRTRVEIEPIDAGVVRRPAAAPVPPKAITVIAPAWPGLDALDVVVAGRPPGDDGREYEPWRIRAGIPRMGAELDARTIPAEAGITDLTVSFNKGCYTGQELVARVDSRGGNVPRHLRGMRAGGPLAAGQELSAGGAPAGVITSAAPDPEGDGWVALGYVRRPFGIDALLDASGTPVHQVVLRP